MDRVALTGGPLTGKTTLAQGLEVEGYMRINFTDYLKNLLILALAAVGVVVTMQQIHQEKEAWRGLLLEFGRHVGFDTAKYVKEALKPWLDGGMGRVVFDNVLFPEQAEALKQYGFKIVHLIIPPHVLSYRATMKGSDEVEVLTHAREVEDDGTHYLLSSHRPVWKLVDEVMDA